MSLETPKTGAVADNIVSQIEASIGQSVPLLPKAFIRVLAKAVAGVFTLLYKYGGWMFLQIFVRTASARETEVNGAAVVPLEMWGELIGVGKRARATAAELTIDITVETQGGVLDSGTQLIKSSTGVTYITIGSVALDAPTVSATIRAVADQADGGGAGTIGNLDPGAVVAFANPLGAVDREAVVTAQTVTGADAEAVAAYRRRIIDRFRRRPQGGAYADYAAWGVEPSGIVNVYPYTSANPGQVDVYVEAAGGDGVPTSAQLQEVRDIIDLDASGRATRRPATALVNTFAITRKAFAVEVVDMTVDDAATVQAQIIAAVADYFLEREPFILGLSIPPRQDRITPGAVAGVIDRIVNAAGGVFGAVRVFVDGDEIQVYSLDIGEKAKSDGVTFL